MILVQWIDIKIVKQFVLIVNFLAAFIHFRETIKVYSITIKWCSSAICVKSGWSGIFKISFNPERRKRWLSALGFEENHQFPKRVELCSKHFGENAFVYGSEGQKTLKRDAIPLISHSLFDPAVSTSSE
ncbi:unnamed protein product [Acanthoscelides obtectus]|uniref:THAP-type domain-containing protein n=1 Tax=Acanthoscelides obtectus TaxID=200917 RepID=A0A9P0M7M5_ACAOB|nr:unnamed protein product [Acanthoscelides obtectus]CAK1671571.1 hypothetical protein AOBTE_LOCUS28328 [Acanthoscelides obtectus]